MSEIPVGSPPVPPGRHAAPGGWYTDPVDVGQERYWDGWQWSRNTRPKESAGHPFPSPHPYQAAPDQIQGPAPIGGHHPYPPSPAGHPVPFGPAGPTTADGVPLAGWGWRLLALVIDNVLVSLLVSLLTFRIVLRVADGFAELMRQAAQGVAVDPTAAANLFSGSDQVITLVASLGVGAIYHIGMLRWKGATLGKLACGLRVAPVDRGRNVEPLAWSSLVTRVAICLLPAAYALLYVFRLIDVLFPLWHPKRQALHDLAAKTQVVRAQRP